MALWGKASVNVGLYLLDSLIIFNTCESGQLEGKGGREEGIEPPKQMNTSSRWKYFNLACERTL